MTLTQLTCRAVVLCACLGHGIDAAAANHYVRQNANGTGSGADWANAYPTLPANLTRGDTYYVAAGQYGVATFADPESASLVITIKKATATDHGTDIGWQPSYGAGPATWRAWDLARGFYVLDGQTRSNDWRSGYGFKVGPTTTAGAAVDLFNGGVSTASSIVLRYIEVEGNGLDNSTFDDGIYSPNGNDNVTIQYSYVHDVGRALVLTGFTHGWTLEYSLLARNSSSAVVHGEGWAGSADSDLTIRYNRWEDIEGTGYLVMLNRGAGTGVCANVSIYGNVFMYSDGNPYQRHGLGNGVIVSINNQSAVDWKIYNNSFINLNYGLSSRIQVGAEGALNNSGVAVYNNFWWRSNIADNTFENCTGCGAQANRYDATVAYVETGKEANSTANPSVFVNFAQRDFRLASPTQAGIPLPASYAVDLDGNARGADGGWDRGAYELFTTGGAASVPTAPTNTRITN
jgi:hypothetical protein